jgi:hypothetical protein
MNKDLDNFERPCRDVTGMMVRYGFIGKGIIPEWFIS